MAARVTSERPCRALITHLVDTDRIIDYLNDRLNARVALTPLIEAQQLATSFIVLGELYEGLIGAPTSDARRAGLDALLGGIALLNLDDETARAFAALRSDLRSKGQLLADHDGAQWEIAVGDGLRRRHQVRLDTPKA